jgi:hypothetical protein
MRRVTFLDSEEEGHFKIKTEIVRPPSGPGTLPEDKLEPVDKDCKPDPANPACTTVGPVAFEDYVQKDGLVNWKKKHVCIFIDHDAHKGSHKQLWVLVNKTSALHNFHIHQMKFRLATLSELVDHHITPPKESHDTSSGSDIQLYDKGCSSEINPEPVWHDTIPIPPLVPHQPSKSVFLIMSFDAKEQVGRFVYHCHILKHEDKGLMAPIEVWEPTPSLP